MADERTWDLADIRSEWRTHTGRSSTADISDVNVNKLINDYYVNHFPADAGVDEFDGFFTQALSATDDGKYAVAQNIDRLDDPVTVNGEPIKFYRDRELFFSGHGGINTIDHQFTFPGIGLGKFEDEQFITEPGLVIGTSDTAKVKHSAFDYSVQRFSYSKASSEVALTGSAIPAGKYGAWSLRIDTDGDITVTAADDNVTGYDTPRKALEALTIADNDSAYMGYVTVIKSDGAFTPATTTLDASNVTATFTDGRFEIRRTPVAALLYGQNLYIRPKPNDIYQFKALTIADRPTAFASDSDTPDDLKWGPLIALGAALLFLVPKGSTERLLQLTALMKVRRDGINLDKYKRLKDRIPQATI